MLSFKNFPGENIIVTDVLRIEFTYSYVPNLCVHFTIVSVSTLYYIDTKQSMSAHIWDLRNLHKKEIHIYTEYASLLKIHINLSIC